MLLWEFASRQQPYAEFSAMQVRENVKDGERLPIPEGTPSGFAALIGQCWSQGFLLFRLCVFFFRYQLTTEPMNRPSARTIVEKLMELGTGSPTLRTNLLLLAILHIVSLGESKTPRGEKKLE